MPFRGHHKAELAAARARIAELEAEIARLSARDPLVASLLTLPALRAQLELDVKRAHRYGRSLAIAVIDIDGFRQLNMSRGYGAGDMVLGAVGDLLSTRTRTHDLVCRSAGDEFTVLFPETAAEEARTVLERILVDVVSLEKAGARGVSASAGIAALRPDQAPDSLLADAQRALTLARARGGGRIAVAGDNPSEGHVIDLPERARRRDSA